MPEPRYTDAPTEVIQLARGIIYDHQIHLANARIGFVFRNEMSPQGGKDDYGYTKLISKENQFFIPYDFVVTIVEDRWTRLSPLQQKALVDHLLCHCGGTPAKWRMRKHDYEEFIEVVARYGVWEDKEGHVTDALQQALITHPPLGKVESVKVRFITAEARKAFATLDDDNDDSDLEPA